MLVQVSLYNNLFIYSFCLSMYHLCIVCLWPQVSSLGCLSVIIHIIVILIIIIFTLFLYSQAEIHCVIATPGLSSLVCCQSQWQSMLFLSDNSIKICPKIIGPVLVHIHFIH